jgi:TIR domain
MQAGASQREVAMATVYVSYRSTEEPFVRAVMTKLEASHQIRIDYNMPAGVDWRAHQLEELRTCDVFLVFVSKDTWTSDFQNAEMGSARFCRMYVDGKTLIPALIDPTGPPRPLADLDYLDLSHRNVDAAAQEIEQEIERRARRIRLFISHAHRDADIAQRLVDVITANLVVPNGELRCTSVPGYQLDLGAMAPDVLRRELGSALCIAALLTPNSLGNDWVLFELGAAWANVKASIPLLAGGLEDKDIPGPLRGAAGGQLTLPGTLDRLLDQLGQTLGWKLLPGLAASGKRHEFVDYIKTRKFTQDPVAGELKASFTAKLARIGQRQVRLLDHVSKKAKGRPYVSQDELAAGKVAGSGSELYYRLEQLRLLGFLDEVPLGEASGTPIFGWTLSEKYRRDIEP